jgi:hypothetical protein
MTTTTEDLIERDLIAKLEDLKYTYRPDEGALCPANLGLLASFWFLG